MDYSEIFKGKRFLIVPGHYDIYGGAERQSILLGSYLKQTLGLDVHYLGWGGNGRVAAEIQQLGCPAHLFQLDQCQRGFAWIPTLWRLTKYLKLQIKADYLLPFVGIHCKILGSVWKQSNASFSWWNQRDEGREIHGTPTERRLLRTLPAIVSNCHEGRDFLCSKFNIPKERVRLINNGISIPNQAGLIDARARLGIPRGTIVLSMVANLTKYKDHRTLLLAFAKLQESNRQKDYHLVLAGRHGETTQELKALAFDLKLSDSVSMPGSIDYVDALLASTDIVIHSSSKEGCPNAILEAMSHGKPVIATDIPGTRHALGDDTPPCFFFKSNDVDALANRLQITLKNPDLLQQIGIQNLARVKSEFSVHQMANCVLQTVYDHRIRQ